MLQNEIKNKLKFSKTTNNKIEKILLKLDNFKFNWKNLLKIETPLNLNILRNIASVSSIGSSTRIEGSQLNNKEVSNLIKIKDIEITKLETRDEQEIVGYYSVLDLILKNYSTLLINENYVNQLHDLLLKYSNKDHFHKGNYKTLSNQVIATHPNGDTHIIFNTTEPHLVPIEMGKLYSWINLMLKQKDIHPLLAIGAFVYEFLSIHPYQDGNGRLARLLTTLLLLKNKYDFVQYYSFESIIEELKQDYYNSLMMDQKKRNSKNEKMQHWILFFLNCLKILTKRLDINYKKLKENKLKKINSNFYIDKLEFGNLESRYKPLINDRQKKIISFMKRKKTAQINMIEKGLKSYSKNTLKKDLNYLVKNYLLTRLGSGRGVYYILT